MLKKLKQGFIDFRNKKGDIKQEELNDVPTDWLSLIKSSFFPELISSCYLLCVHEPYVDKYFYEVLRNSVAFLCS